MEKISYDYSSEHWKNKQEKAANKIISLPQKLSSYMSQKLLILGNLLCPRNTLQASN